MSCTELVANSVLRETTAGCARLVQRENTVTGVEVADGGADAVDDAGDVVALVEALAAIVGAFPVLGVGAGVDDVDEELGWGEGWDADGVERGDGAGEDEGFEHCCLGCHFDGVLVMAGKISNVW